MNSEELRVPSKWVEAEKELAPQSIIVTTTFYRPDSEVDRLREGLAMETFREACERGYAVIDVDGGSRDELLRGFERLGVRLFEGEEKGVGPPRRQVFEEAGRLAKTSGKKYIAWTEPEKHRYIRSIAKTIFPIANGRADLIVPRRTSLESYPEAQAHEEIFGNEYYAAYTGKYLDLWFGPKTWREEVNRFFVEYRGEHGKDWCYTFIPILDAMKEGERVEGVWVRYTHPKEQTKIEEKYPQQFNQKRYIQLVTLVEGLESWTAANRPLVFEK